MIRQPILLKTILDICYYILLFSFVITSGMLIFSLISSDFVIPVTLGKLIVEEITMPIVVLLAANFLLALLFIMSIYYLRKLVRNFFKSKIFTLEQVFYLKRIGWLITVVSVSEPILDFIAAGIVRRKSEIGLSLDFDYGSIWFLLAIGLFFIYLSQVFENARKLKEENDYTV